MVSEGKLSITCAMNVFNGSLVILTVPIGMVAEIWTKISKRNCAQGIDNALI